MIYNNGILMTGIPSTNEVFANRMVTYISYFLLDMKEKPQVRKEENGTFTVFTEDNSLSVANVRSAIGLCERTWEDFCAGLMNSRQGWK